ncbi:hypothetical protein SARC_00702 [Sphaeroforma arctica JP610]|uniref:Glycosyl transferase CAP10 domain-containing protein n=1 Tax=Sphaeroforma arctica JP610 TaxID=667725 RepID=A0A0L0GE55_9EUKA|nr:hypothetical protein SARC_00702 [Sphaeroforma arctica JP610]KNC87174.1 hypothetical protein SARC_00702 [Sphaeroforma arctica JP610]|eukprot:XP_014161076.1 hypothetical protein SARC_00702 [Sphaeroforma arctica JP610]
MVVHRMLLALAALICVITHPIHAKHVRKCPLEPSPHDKWASEKVLEGEKNWTGCQGKYTACYDQVLSDSLKHWEDGSITKETTQNALASTRLGILYQIIDGKLYRSGGISEDKRCVFSMRCDGVEHMLHAVLDTHKERPMPNVEFVLNERDYPMITAQSEVALPVFSFSRNSRFLDIMYPNWSFFKGGPCVKTEPGCLGRWDLKIESMSRSADRYPWVEKLELAFFRGSRTSNQRDPLVLLSREHPYLAEAGYVKNQAWKSIADTLGREPAEDVSLDDHCKFKYLFNFKGVAASFRFRHLFLCGSLVFHVLSGEDDWLEFFYPGMQPWVHYIPVKPDFSDGQQLIEWAMRYDALAKVVAENGQRFIIDHLRMEDVHGYWYHLLRKYSKLLSYEPSLAADAYEV